MNDGTVERYVFFLMGHDRQDRQTWRKVGQLMRQVLQGLRGRPRIDGRFLAFKGAIEHLGDDRGAGHSLRAPPSRKSVTIGACWPLLRYWRRMMPRPRTSPMTRPGVRKFRRAATSGDSCLAASPSGIFSFPSLVESLPLCDPVRADARPERFHLLAQIVQFGFKNLGALVELKLRKALGEDRLDLIERMRFQEVQDHRIADDELAVDRLRMAGEVLWSAPSDRCRARG